MTQEEKQLLIKDICARLPYGVICNVTHKDGRWKTEDMKLSGVFNKDSQYFTCESGSAYSSDFKPYLRPMLSMTEEEKKEYTSYCFEQPFLQKYKTPNLGSVPMCIDWLNERHFDFRGLIEKGLAFEAPEDMYKTEKI